MKPELVIEQDKSELVQLAAEKFYKIVQSSGQLVHISLSGGNTPKMLFSKIVELYKSKIEWNKVVLWWGDERCVSPEDDQSNYKMTKEHLLDFIDIPAENIHRIKGEDNPEDEALRYGDLISKLITCSNGVPRYDLIYLGLGDDGHTASIFPNQIDLFNIDRNCVTAVHPVSGQRRVSITGPIINNAANVFLLITGENKAKVVREIIKGEPGAENYPASLVDPTDGNYTWYLDKGAAKLL